MARGSIIGLTTELVVEVCSACGVLWGMPTDLWHRCQEDGRRFYCPNGHQLVFTETVVARLKRERDEAIARCAEAERGKKQLGHRLDEALDIMNQQKRRANAGMCLYCRRNFTNVRRHIETQHPEKLKR